MVTSWCLDGMQRVRVGSELEQRWLLEDPPPTSPVSSGSSGESCPPTFASGLTCRGSSQLQATDAADPDQWSGRAAGELVRQPESLRAALRRQDSRDPRLRRRRVAPAHRFGRRGDGRLSGRAAGRLPRRVRPAASLSPRGIEPGMSGHPDLRHPVPRPRGQARPDLPLGFSWRREPAGDGRGQAQPVRHAGQVGLSQGAVRHATIWSRPSSGSSRTASGRRGCCERSAARWGTRWRRSCPWFPIRPWSSGARPIRCSPTFPARSGRPTRFSRSARWSFPSAAMRPRSRRPGWSTSLWSRYLKDKLKAIPPALDPERFLIRHGRPGQGPTWPSVPG